MKAPSGAIAGRLPRTLLALIDVHRRDGRATVRTVAAELGLTSWSHTAEALHDLADLGLVAWEPGTQATLRPLYWPPDERIVVDTVEHIVCCHERTLTLCGTTTDGSVDGDEPDCVVCLELAPNLQVCPLGPGRCHLAEKPTSKEPR